MNSGFINLNKPLHWTSHDCVARLRKLLQTKKVGHGGTLDPLATGVLPIAVGRATRLLQYLPQQKAYRAVIRFGVQTATDDLAGEIIGQQPASRLERAAVEAAIASFEGTIWQVPPRYSAIQIQGQRLYDLARQGKTAEAPPRQVTFYKLSPETWQGGDYPELTLQIDCGPGTYIRSLARDLGAAIGTGATLAGLVRTHSSGFDLADSLTLEELAEATRAEHFSPIPAGEAMGHLRAIALPPDLARRWCLGQKLPLTFWETLSGDLEADFKENFKPDGSGRSPLSSPDLTNWPLGKPLRVIESGSGKFLGIGELSTGESSPPALSTEAETGFQASQNAMSAPQGPLLLPKRVYQPANGIL